MTSRKQLDRIAQILEQQIAQNDDMRAALERSQKEVSLVQLRMLSFHQRRNLLPNDSAALQKTCMMLWGLSKTTPLDHKDLLNSGFRVFSQGDEDGIVLRIFQKIGMANKVVVEIGSNCDDSDLAIPENISSNLIVNHGWHGVVYELDSTECQRIRHFFAQNSVTKHFHSDSMSGGYISPLIENVEVTPENIDDLLRANLSVPEPDLMIIDIDGGDFAIMESMQAIKPRVLVVEFEKRFRELHSVVQRSRGDFGKYYPQSGAASLSAWNKLLSARGYVLCSIATTGFNAFFVRADIAAGALEPVSVRAAFDDHPVLSNANTLWVEPDETWSEF
ncbi:MAG: FkbM family methyltransferase [Alphaproteobacteria bacterium]|nr:FkbM family methyltransferase [Alphaproteobacteria bacterium]MBU1562603.1 FkbM family methyltransferase [Alphaproteobacteria bacterium]MBU2303245.1 FkbM family methyltransferase [Alphaproteobacteria bacterium]MBU2370380.1 FkbM family methyltransferase [Alphaproteobacteria bacterium]